MLLAALIGPVIAVATTEAFATWWKIEFSHSPSANPTVDH